MAAPASSYLLLAGTIVFEVMGTMCLEKSQQFTRLWPSLGVFGFYAVSIYALTQVLKTIPLGIAYAIWASCGIVLTAVLSAIFLKQTLDWPAILGIGLIVAGVLVINLFSSSVGH
jgi:small multidrug resistance pump